MIRFTSKKLKKDLEKRIKFIESIQISHSGIQTQLKEFVNKYKNDLLIGPVYKFYKEVCKTYKGLNKAIDESRENSYSNRWEIAKNLANILEGTN